MIEKYVNAEELKRLLSTLIVVLGALTVAGLFASILVPGLRNANKPPAPMPVKPVVGEPGWLNPAEFPAERGRVIPPVDPKTLLVSSADLLAKGKTAFARDCAPCHGATGLGDGPAASTLNPRPRDFSRSEGWKNGADLPAIYKTLTEGISGSAMSPFDYLSKGDRTALAHYVQSLAPAPARAGSPEALEALAQALAAAGETTPNKIPVSTAITRLVEEFNAPRPLVIAADDQDAGAEILRRVVADPVRAAQTLAGSASWRMGVREFAADVLPDAPGNGFAVSLSTLKAADWQALHARLLKLLPEPGAGLRK